MTSEKYIAELAGQIVARRGLQPKRAVRLAAETLKEVRLLIQEERASAEREPHRPLRRPE